MLIAVMRSNSSGILFLAGVAVATLTPNSLAMARVQHEPPKTNISNSIWQRESDTDFLEPVDVRFSTEEGTHMSVHASPDGKWILFDMIGQIYRVAAEGGEAELLIGSGWAWNHSPRFSPDGQFVAYLSDRDGVQDLWLFDLKTRNHRRVTNVLNWVPPGELPEAARMGMAGVPHWLPGGQELVAGLRSGRSRPLLVDVTNGKLRPLDEPPTSRLRAAGTASFTTDGKIAFYSMIEVTDRGMDRLWPVRSRLFRVDLEKAETTSLTDREAIFDEVAPEVSPDGRYLAYLRRDGNRTELRLRDLQTGSDRWLRSFTGVPEPYRAGTDSIPFPGYSFTPDGGAIIIAAEGRIRRIEVGTGGETVIPITVDVHRRVERPLEARYRLKDGPVELRALRFPARSTDGRLVFSAGGAVWMRKAGEANPQRITSRDEELADMPALSGDGRHVAYVRFENSGFEHAGPGRLVVRPVDGGANLLLTEDDGSYYLPRWSPDGTKLAVIREQGQISEFGWINLSDGRFRPVRPARSFLQPDERGSLFQFVDWTEDGRLIVQSSTRYRGHKVDISVDIVSLDGASAHRLVTSSSGVFAVSVSPDLRRAVMIGPDFQAYVVDLPQGNRTTKLSLTMSGARRISDAGALHPQWLGAREFGFGFGNDYFIWRVGDAKASRVARTQLTLPRRQGEGTYAIRGARLITAADSGNAAMYERGTIVVRGRRIVAVGTVESVFIPTDARIIDGTGLTLMPGLVDTHYHDAGPGGLRASYFAPTVLPNPGMRAALAYGITTAFEAGGATLDDSSLSYQELIDTGSIRGVRWLFDSSSITNYANPSAPISLNDVRRNFARQRSMGSGPCLKIQGEKNRLNMRRYVRVAKEQGFCIVAHTDASTDFFSYVTDGVAPHHWALPSPLFSDLRKYLTYARARYSPHSTFSYSTSVQQGSAAKTALDILQSRLTPAEWDRTMKHARPMNRFLTSYDGHDPQHSGVMKEFKDHVTLLRSGVPVGLSGDIPIGADLRLEMIWFQEAGATPLEIIHSATNLTAKQLGLFADVGSLEPGKIADFLVLTRNPLDDIINTLSLKWTVVDGLAYDSKTLEPVQLASDTLFETER